MSQEVFAEREIGKYFEFYSSSVTNFSNTGGNYHVFYRVNFKQKEIDNVQAEDIDWICQNFDQRYKTSRILKGQYKLEIPGSNFWISDSNYGERSGEICVHGEVNNIKTMREFLESLGDVLKKYRPQIRNEIKIKN